MQVYSANASIFFCPQKIENTAIKTQIHFFSLLPWAAKAAKTEEFMFQNVAYRPTVYV